MSPVLKILVGALMMVLGIFVSTVTYSTQLIELIQGGIGPLLILVGAFIVWLESDELKIQREESASQQRQEFEKQQTLNQQTTSGEREAKEAAKEIRQAVSTGKETPDPQEILSGTVREVKEEVSDREDIDVKELLEAEKSGKNRTTLVDYLERRVD